MLLLRSAPDVCGGTDVPQPRLKPEEVAVSFHKSQLSWSDLSPDSSSPAACWFCSISSSVQTQITALGALSRVLPASLHIPALKRYSTWQQALFALNSP